MLWKKIQHVQINEDSCSANGLLKPETSTHRSLFSDALAYDLEKGCQKGHAYAYFS